MSHCPQCGEATPEGARACPFCGTMLVAAARPPAAAGRTMVGVSKLEVAPAAQPPQQPAPLPQAAPFKASRTIVGMPATAVPGVARAIEAANAAQPAQAPPPAAPPAGAPRAPIGRTIVGMAASDVLGPTASAPLLAPPAGAPRMPAGGTLLGVARPGIAPLAPGVDQDGPTTEDEPDLPPNYAPAQELGATMGPVMSPQSLAVQAAKLQAAEDDKRRRRVFAQPKMAAKPAPRAADPSSKRAVILVGSAGALALAAVLVAVFWPSAPPLTARPRADASGREGVELTCKTCPDGTKLTIAGASATTAGGVGLVVLPTPLSVGENRLKVEIDRPGNGRDETVSVAVNVGYRIRPDLATLQAEKPSFQILAEVAGGTTVTIDGRKMPLSSGHGVDNVDVTDVCTGLANEVKTLSRQIPYVVTPESGPPEQGVVNVSVGIVPLHLDAPVTVATPANGAAPAPHVVTDGPSFVLAGWTMKGAEVLAAGRPITVHPDGTFAQVMNVSSVGATQIEVRARMPGMAPRLSSIKVRRVESLDKAAREFAGAESPIAFAALAKDIAGSTGKAVALSGELSEVKKVGYQTVMLMEVSAASGCAGGSCTVRLVQGAENPAKRGDSLRVFGHVARAFSLPGRADIPEIEVDFTLKGDRK
jgi:hypothetical protein